jgi:hypothetical protein
MRDFLTTVRVGLGEAVKGLVFGLLLLIIVLVPAWLLLH